MIKDFIQWVRAQATRADRPTDFEQQHYEKFERALQESDVEVQIFEEGLLGIKGAQLIMKGTDLHPVTVRNLVAFRKLNRRERRRIPNVYVNQTNKQKT